MKSNLDRYVIDHKNLSNFRPTLREQKNKLDKNFDFKGGIFGLPRAHSLYPEQLLRSKLDEFIEMDALRKVSEDRIKEMEFSPVSILDAPGLMDDFYLNVLDWSKKDIVSLALGESVFCYKYHTKEAYCLTSLHEGSYISAINSFCKGDKIFVASSSGCVSLFDTSTSQELIKHSISVGEDRIAVMTSKDNLSMFSDHLLFTGDRKGNISGFDTRRRVKKCVMKVQGHNLEVCGLDLAQDSWLLASGGNDNIVNIWDIRRFDDPLAKYDDFNAAIKALHWCPWRRNLLAAGSGTGDRKIRIFNTSTNCCIKETNTESQVCKLFWSEIRNEIISAHGYNSNNLRIWSYPEMNCLASIPAHDNRLIDGAISPDGTTLATCAANETLKFWELYKRRPILRRPTSGERAYERDLLEFTR